MTEIIHEHHEDSSVSLLAIVLIILVVAIGGYLLWRYLPASTTNGNTNQPNVNLNVTLPPAAPATP